MDVDELLDKALEEGDLVPPSSQDYIDRRRRALSFLQEIFEDAYWRRDWPFKRKGPTTLTVTAGAAKVAAPLDFQSIGSFGGLYNAQNEPLLEVPESVIFDDRIQGAKTDTPEIFSLFGQDPVTYRIYFQFPPHDSAMTFYLFYQARPPRLIDAYDTDLIDTIYASTLTRSGTTCTFTATTDHGFRSGDYVTVAGAVETEYNGTHQITVTGTTTFTFEVTTTPSSPATTLTDITAVLSVTVGNQALNSIDPQYHHSVLLNGTKAKMRESKGDGRWKYLQGEYERSVAAMLREEQRFQSDRMPQIPSFFGTMGRSRY